MTLKTQLEAQLNLATRKATLMLDAAERDGRGLSADEEKEHKQLLADITALGKRLEKVESDDAQMREIERVTSGMVPHGADPHAPRLRGSLGQQFVQSDAMKWLRDTRNSRAGAWSSPSVDLFATTLDESVGSGGSLVLPDVRPGIVPLPLRPPVVRDLIMPGTTTSNLVQFQKESTFTNAAAATLEGTPKPESTLIFTPATSPVQKLAHWVPATTEILDDVPQLQSYIDARLRAGLQTVEDDELLNGSGVAPHLLGYMNLPGLAPPVARGTDTNADAIFKQISAITTATNLTPDGIILNPLNWMAIQIAKTTTGEYVNGSSPLAAPVPQVLWGKACAVTTAIPVGVALVGCFKTASQLFDRTGIRVSVTNSHLDFFVRNLVAILAEERLALAVWRESAFGLVTGLS